MVRTLTLTSYECTYIEISDTYYHYNYLLLYIRIIISLAIIFNPSYMYIPVYQFGIMIIITYIPIIKLYLRFKILVYIL